MSTHCTARKVLSGLKLIRNSDSDCELRLIARCRRLEVERLCFIDHAFNVVYSQVNVLISVVPYVSDRGQR